VITLMGIPVAFGETFEDVISFPIPDNITGQEKKGQLITLTDNLLEMQFTYKFYLGQNGTAWFEKILEEVGLAPDETLCPETMYLDEETQRCYPLKNKPPSPEFIIPKPKDLTKFEKQLERYEEHPPKTYDQQDELRKLQELDECYEGLKQSRGIQSYGSFYTSEYDEVQNVPKAGVASALDIAIERCHAEARLLPILGDDRDPEDIKSTPPWLLC